MLKRYTAGSKHAMKLLVTVGAPGGEGGLHKTDGFRKGLTSLVSLQMIGQTCGSEPCSPINEKTPIFREKKAKNLPSSKVEI